MSEEARDAPDELSARVGELRRLTFMYCDVVGSTELSGRLEPEAYRELIRRYIEACRDVIENRFEGHIVHVTGDGALSTFGFPVAHENDAERAVRAGLALVQAVHELSAVATSTVPESLEVRVGIHHGPVYLDFDEDDIYGLAANVGARLQTLADPGTVVVSEEVRELVEDRFELAAGEAQFVKGVAEPIVPFKVEGDRVVPTRQSWPTPLVEREAELAQLRSAWAQVTAGTGDRAVGLLVRGDAGVGKSRLVAALDDEVCGGKACFVQLFGSPFHVDAGFHPVRTLIEARSGIGDDTVPAERLRLLKTEVANLGIAAAAAIPFLAPVLGIDPSAGYTQVAAEGRKLEEQVAGTVFDYVVACTKRQPAVVVAENVHWFDDSTRTLLGDLMRDGPATMLLVATSRENEVGVWDTIELQPLSLDGRLALIDALDDDVAEEDRLALAKRSDGIPLFLEELVRTGTVEYEGPAEAIVPMPGSVPAALYEPLVARLYATPAALPVAAAAAAAGPTVDRSLLAATMSMPAEELDSTLRDLVEAGVLESIAGDVGRYEFRHELLREVAYELQPVSWRRKCHDKMCDFLNRDEPSDWTVLALHCERAERRHEAAIAYQNAAESARRRGAMDEARSHLTRAIALGEQLPADEARDHLEIDLRLRRAYLAMTADGVASPDAAADFDRCIELASVDPTSDDMLSTSISVFTYDMSRADLGRAQRILETIRDGLDSEREYFRPRNSAGFGMVSWYEGRFSQAATELEAAMDALTVIGREDEVAAVWFVPSHPTVAMYVHLALARFMVADTGGADECLELARAMTATIDFPQGPWSADWTRWHGSWIWMETGRYEMAAEALADLHSSSARHGFDNWELVATTQGSALEAIRAVRSGTADPAALLEHADALGTQVELWQMLELRIFLSFYMTTVGAALAAAGNVDGARERYEQSLALSAETGMCFYDAETRRLLAHLSADREEVVANLRAALEFARSQAARPFELRIALDLHKLLGETGRPDLEQAIRPFDGGVATAELEEARARVMTPL